MQQLAEADRDSTLLMTIPGIGVTLATLISTEIDGIERFDKLLKPWLVHTEHVGKMSPTQDDSDTRLEGFEPTTLGSEDRCSIR